jgi:hypothetical protein
VVESLIKCGALISTGQKAGMMAAPGIAMELDRRSEEKDSAQVSLFGLTRL